MKKPSRAGGKPAKARPRKAVKRKGRTQSRTPPQFIPYWPDRGRSAVSTACAMIAIFR
jgi:hypothetical protein